MNRGPRVVVFGGMFDPPHLGHLTALAAGSRPGDTIVVVVAGVPSHRRAPIASAQQRMELARSAFARSSEHAGALAERDVIISDVEIATADDGTPPSAYMIDTIERLRADGLIPAQKRPVLLLGADQAVRLRTWHRWRDLLDIVDLAVVARATRDAQLDVNRLQLDADAHGADIDWISIPPQPAASSLIRGLIATGHLDAAAELVPSGVAQQLQQLYGSATNSTGHGRMGIVHTTKGAHDVH